MYSKIQNFVSNAAIGFDVVDAYDIWIYEWQEYLKKLVEVFLRILYQCTLLTFSSIFLSLESSY